MGIVSLYIKIYILTIYIYIYIYVVNIYIYLNKHLRQKLYIYIYIYGKGAPNGYCQYVYINIYILTKTLCTSVKFNFRITQYPLNTLIKQKSIYKQLFVF